MPSHLRYSQAGINYQFEIKKWQLNPIEGLKLEEFFRPEDRKGWNVVGTPHVDQ